MHELYFCYFLHLTFPYGPSTSVLRDFKQQRIKTNLTNSSQGRSQFEIRGKKKLSMSLDVK